MKRVLTRLTPTERERAREQWREDGRRAPRARAGALPALNALVQRTSLARAAREEDDAALADSTAAQGMGKIRGGAQGRGRSGRAVLLIDAARRSSVVLAAVRERRGEAAGGAGRKKTAPQALTSGPERQWCGERKGRWAAVDRGLPAQRGRRAGPSWRAEEVEERWAGWVSAQAEVSFFF